MDLYTGVHQCSNMFYKRGSHCETLRAGFMSIQVEDGDVIICMTIK